MNRREYNEAIVTHKIQSMRSKSKRRLLEAKKQIQWAEFFAACLHKAPTDFPEGLWRGPQVQCACWHGWYAPIFFPKHTVKHIQVLWHGAL
jgi:hypothetical protein